MSCRVMRLAEVRRKNILPYLGPDGKSQVTIEYVDGKPKRLDTVVISTQHSEDILDKTGRQITEKSRKEITEAVIRPVAGKFMGTACLTGLKSPDGTPPTRFVGESGD